MASNRTGTRCMLAEDRARRQPLRLPVSGRWKYVCAPGAGAESEGYGRYHETYEKIDRRWYIKSSKLTRLREDIFNPVLQFGSLNGCADAAGALVRKRTK